MNCIKLTECPYDDSHITPYSELDKHLEECRGKYFQYLAKHNFAVPAVVCAYNKKHIVVYTERDIHEKICPDKWDEEPYKSPTMMNAFGTICAVVAERTKNYPTHRSVCYGFDGSTGKWSGGDDDDDEGKKTDAEVKPKKKGFDEEDRKFYFNNPPELIFEMEL